MVWRKSLVSLCAAVVLLAACGAGDETAAPVVAPTATPVVVIPTSTPVPAAPTSVKSEVEAVPVVTNEPERVNTVVDPLNPPLCLVLIPTHPTEGSTGSVAYAFSADTIEFEYQSLYVKNYIGGSALKAGLPGVRTGDQFTFFIDDAMQIPTGDPKIVTALPDGSDEPCAIRWVPGETVEAIDGAAVGY